VHTNYVFNALPGTVGPSLYYLKRLKWFLILPSQYVKHLVVLRYVNHAPCSGPTRARLPHRPVSPSHTDALLSLHLSDAPLPRTRCPTHLLREASSQWPPDPAATSSTTGIRSPPHGSSRHRSFPPPHISRVMEVQRPPQIKGKHSRMESSI
jgi:hypothetical protein